MKDLGLYTSSKGNQYDLHYFEDIKTAEAVGPLPKTVGSPGPVITIKIAENENPKDRLIEELKKGDY